MRCGDVWSGGCGCLVGWRSLNGNAFSLSGVCVEWHISLATRNGHTNYQLVKGERTTVVNEVGAYKDLSSFPFTPFFPLDILRADGKQMVVVKTRPA